MTQTAGAAPPEDPERALALGYVPAARRAAVAALLELDATLGDTVRAARGAAAAQLRLAWWHEGLSALGADAPDEAPLLARLRAAVLPEGVTAAELAALIEGWDVLVEAERLDEAALAAFGERRGAALFALVARLLEAPNSEPVRAAGAGWALADLAGNLGDAGEAARARALAAAALDRGAPLPRRLRSLALLARAARLDLAGVPRGSPRRAARLAWTALTGR